MNRTEKQAIVEKLSEQFKEAGSVVMADFTGLTVAQAEDLRAKFEDSGSTYQVVKNTLIKRAIDGSELETLNELCQGPSAIAIGYDDPSAPAKILGDFVKDNPKRMKIKGGYLSGKLLDVEGVKRLSKMPSLEELRSQIAGVIAAPAQKLASQINAPMQQLVGVVQARVDEGEK